MVKVSELPTTLHKVGQYEDSFEQDDCSLTAHVGLAHFRVDVF